MSRDNFTCVNCKCNGDFNSLEADHIIPVVNGGTNEESNLQTLCYKCNMDKRFGKTVVNKFIIDLSPIKKLELVKERLKLYKHLTYPEFKVVYTQDELFKRLRLDLLYLNDLFYEVSGISKADNYENPKYTIQRNNLIKIIKSITGKTYQELEKLLKSNGINISFQQLAKICKQID